MRRLHGPLLGSLADVAILRNCVARRSRKILGSTPHRSTRTQQRRTAPIAQPGSAWLSLAQPVWPGLALLTRSREARLVSTRLPLTRAPRRCRDGQTNINKGSVTVNHGEIVMRELNRNGSMRDGSITPCGRVWLSCEPRHRSRGGAGLTQSARPAAGGARRSTSRLCWNVGPMEKATGPADLGCRRGASC